jgi:glutamate synthase (NADPH/NADH) small chain
VILTFDNRVCELKAMKIPSLSRANKEKSTMSTALKLNRVGPFPFPKSDPKTRKDDFSEVQQPYTRDQVILEADRCARCGTPVCIAACPLQTDVRGMCDAVAQGDFGTAYHRIRQTNALPGVTARCCPQLQGLCEETCVMSEGGQSISIGMIQRFVADWERTNSRQLDPELGPETGKHVAIIGGGPAGLAAAELLRRYGHLVTIYEELPVLGGTAWYGIPDYHLAKDVLQYETERVRGMGVEIKTGIRVGKDIPLPQLTSEYDAVLVATGAKDVMKFDTPGADIKGVYDGYKFLEDVFVNGIENYAKNPHYELGSEVLVIGGGNSALDCARTAKRLTHGNVTIVYRRTEAEMPVDKILVEEAKEEDIQLKFLMAPEVYNSADGKLVGVTMSIMRLGAVDASGRRSPELTGEEVEIKCDSAIVAIGRGPNSFLQKLSGMKMGNKGGILTDDHYRTSIPEVFAAGDVVTGETLVCRAMAKGREAAQRIHEFLMSSEDKHQSLFDWYFTRRTTLTYYQGMMMGGQDEGPPPT